MQKMVANCFVVKEILRTIIILSKYFLGKAGEYSDLTAKLKCCAYETPLSFGLYYIEIYANLTMSALRSWQ